MIKAWPKVRLGEVLHQCDTAVPVSDLGEINLAGVYSFGRGLFKRGLMSPTETTYKTYNRLITDDFVISVPKAWEGALARVTPKFEGWYLSPVFPTFRADRGVLLPEFLEWFCKRECVWEELRRKSRGIGARRESVHPKQFLSIEIPLPPLPEQQRIVSRIEELAAQINEACTLRQQADDDAEALLLSMAHRVDLSNNEKERLGWRRICLSEVICYVDDSIPVIVNESYPNFGIYSFGRGLFPKPPIEGALTSAKTLRRVRENQFIYSRLFAFEGAYGMVTRQYDGAFISNEYPTFNCTPQLVRPEFLAAYFKSPMVWSMVAVGSKGLGDRRQRVQPTQVLAHQLWLPPLSYQEQLSDIKIEVDKHKHVQVQTASELDALLPAILDKAYKGSFL